MNLTFSLIPYYKIPFGYGEIFKDNRNIEMIDVSIDNLPSRIIDIIAGVVYSFVSSIIVSLILKIFYYLIKPEENMIKIWKQKKDNLVKYINTYLNLSFKLKPKWESLRFRIIVFSRLCSKWIHIKKRNKEHKENNITEYNTHNRRLYTLL